MAKKKGGTKGRSGPQPEGIRNQFTRKREEEKKNIIKINCIAACLPVENKAKPSKAKLCGLATFSFHSLIVGFNTILIRNENFVCPPFACGNQCLIGSTFNA